MRTSINLTLNPIYTLRNQSIRSVLNNVKVSTFINTEDFPFPPDEANIVFFKDKLTLKDYINGTSIGKATTEKDGQNINYMVSGKGSEITILPAQKSSDIFSKYKTLRYGEKIHIDIPQTSEMMSGGYEEDDFLRWDYCFWII